MIFNHKGITITLSTIPDTPAPLRQRERETVGRLIATLMPEAELDHMPTGAPVLSGIRSRISITHGGGMAAVAIGAPHTCFGIDIEAPREQLRRVKSRFLTLKERDVCGEDLDSLLSFWTAKEAVYKAMLIPGLPLTDIHVDLSQSSAETAGRTFSLLFRDINGLRLCIATS